MHTCIQYQPPVGYKFSDLNPEIHNGIPWHLLDWAGEFMIFLGGAVLVGKSRLSKNCKKMSGISNESKKYPWRIPCLAIVVQGHNMLRKGCRLANIRCEVEVFQDDLVWDDHGFSASKLKKNNPHHQVKKSQMFYILSSKCYISTMASSEINTSWGKFELKRCPSNLLHWATLLRELRPEEISNFTREVSSPWKMLRLTLKQAHIQQLRLLKDGKVFLFAACYFPSFFIDVSFLKMTVKIHLSQVDRFRHSSTSASWSRAHSSRAREPGALHMKMSSCTCCLKRKYGINTHIPTDRTVVGTPPCFNLLQSLRNCHHKAGRI